MLYIFRRIQIFSFYLCQFWKDKYMCYFKDCPYHLHFQTFWHAVVQNIPFFTTVFLFYKHLLAGTDIQNPPLTRFVTFVPPLKLVTAAFSQVHWEWKSCFILGGTLRAESESKFVLPSLLPFSLGSWPYKSFLLSRFLYFLTYIFFSVFCCFCLPSSVLVASNELVHGSLIYPTVRRNMDQWALLP